MIARRNNLRPARPPRVHIYCQGQQIDMGLLFFLKKNICLNIFHPKKENINKSGCKTERDRKINR